MPQLRVTGKTIKLLNEIIAERKKQDHYINTQIAVIAEAVEGIHKREVKKK